MYDNKLRKKDFVKAAKILNKYGWITDESGNKEVGFCAIGALWEASGERFGNHEIMESLNLSKDSIVAFNDIEADSKEDVQTLLLFLGEMVETN